MGKLITPLIIGFFAGLSGGGFFTVWRTASAHDAAVVAMKLGKPAPSGAHGDSTAAHDSTTSDSTAHASGGAHDSAATAAPASAAPTDGHATPAAAAPAAHAAPDAHAAPATSGAPATTTPASDIGALPRTAGQEARLGKLFGAMAPKDAARVLAQMDNRDVQTILTLIGDKQAAAILALLPADHAVAFSTGQLRRAGGE
jgi:hypothetical protein